MRTIISTLLLWSCVGGVPTDTGKTGSDLQWFTTCGDPVCQGYTGPFDGVPLCTTEAEGDPCDTDGAQCDPQDDCNARLVCATEDPKDQTGGCPISRAEHKTDIAYLDAAARRSAAREALGIKLATWRYKGEEGERLRLGFLIDDDPASPAVRPDGERVDLYGYTSLAIAALQEQQAEIDALKAEVDALKAKGCP